MADESMSETSDAGASPAPPTIGGVLANLQDRLAHVFGVHPADREATVVAMLARSPGEAAGYWLKLLLAMGIASLGLVLGSTAVVIGAMLISPLMGPIVELGMGLAVGSPLLVLRSFARTTASVALVVGSAALLTLTLPFQEVTAEIAARTAPTALDLLIAIFCAIAAAYTTIRPGSDTTGTAAGTAIGIALVPPLCVFGYGIGTGAKNISSGAALLFTANFCAILLFAVLAFLSLGYSRASAAVSEQVELDRTEKGIILRFARALRFLFGMKYGPLLRVLMPLLLLAGVYLPLREALAQVTWQVRVRASIQRMLGELPESAVRSSISVERDGVAVRLVMLGRAEDASKLEKDLTNRIAAVAGMVPKIHVIAVPDANALEAVTQKLEASKSPVVVSPKIPALDAARADLDEALRGTFPRVAGPLVATRVVYPEGAPIIVELVHFGPELGAAGVALLGDRVSNVLGSEIALRDVAVSPDPIEAEPADAEKWLSLALGRLAHVEGSDAFHGCVEAPVGAASKPAREAEMVVAALRGLSAYRDKRISIAEGARWKLSISMTPCVEPAGTANETATDGGAP